ncbi:DUF2339 domain-containing protein [Chloroflexi bacterium TSY]|nr:DUF2339 domain-containing protein [Chloroflexi bacterium TSY]
MIIGVGFLVKLVADMGWFPIEVRLASAALLGVGLAAVGWAVRKRARTYGLVLQGGGIGIIYLTTYGTYQIYGLIGPTLAFGIFVGLGLLTVLLSLLNDARVLAFMAVIGAFLAPILISTGSGSHVVLFSYYAVVNLMILAISWFKRWRSLNLVGFLFTLGVGSTWGAQYYQPQFFSTVEPFLVFFFLLYLTISFLFATRSYHEQESRREALVEDGLILFGNPLAALTLQSTLVANIEYGLAWSTLISGLLYIGLAIVLLNRDSQRAEITSEIFLFLGFAFLTLTVPLAFDPRVTAAVWAGAGAGKVWLGHRRDRLWMMLWGVLVQGGAAIAYLIDISDRVDDLILEPPFLNAIYLGALLLSLSALFSAYLLNNRRSAYKYLTQFSWLVSAYGLLVWYLAGIVQISEAVVEPHTFASIVLFVVGSSVFFAVFGKRLAWTALRVPIWGLLPVQILSMFAQLAGTGHFSSNGGWYAWPIALLATYWMLYQNDPQKHHSAIQDNDDAKKLGLQAPYHLGAFWVLMFVLTWEIAYQLGQLDLGAGWSQAVWIGLPALLMAVISRFGGVVHFRRTIRFTFLQREKMFIFSTLSHAQAENDLI